MVQMSVIILFQTRINYNGNYSSDPMSRKWFRKKLLRREQNSYFCLPRLTSEMQAFYLQPIYTHKFGKGGLFERVSKFHLMDLPDNIHLQAFKLVILMFIFYVKEQYWCNLVTDANRDSHLIIIISHSI